MADRALRIAIVTFGVLVTASLLLLWARDTSMILNWSRSGYVVTHILVDTRKDVETFGAIDPADFVGSVPSTGDTLVSIADSASTGERWIRLLRRHHDAGREVPVAYRHGADTLETVLRTRAVAPALGLSASFVQGLRLLIVLVFAGLGFFAFAKRPESTGVRMLTMFSFSMAGFMAFIQVPTFYRVLASFRIPAEAWVASLVSIQANAFAGWWLLLAMVFPRPRVFYKRHKALAYLAAFGPLTLFVGLQVALYRDTMTPQWMVYAFFGVLVAQVGSAQLRIARISREADSLLEKRQADLVGRGSVVTLLAVGILALDWTGILPHIGRLPLLPRLLVTTVPYLLLLAAPVSFALAMRRYRLMDVEIRLRRGTWHVASNGALAAVYIGLVYAVGVLLLDVLQIQSRALTVLTAVAVAMLFMPVRRRLQHRIEARLFPERRKLQQMAQDFLQIAATVPDRVALGALLETRLQDCLGVSHIAPVLGVDPASGALRDAHGPVPLDPDGDLVRHLRTDARPLFVDEAFVSRRICVRPREREWIRSRDIALLLPVHDGRGLQGIVGIGPKADREDFRPHEVEILEGLSHQVAWSLGNLKLLEENLEKRRMEDELRLARSVQIRLLPAEIPEVPGLEIAANSSSCREVAGDYYDVIPLPVGRTLIAVADVSGKGAAAALLMANLQAALRAFSGLDLPLSGLVERINSMVCRNTAPDQFITFFAAVLDPQRRHITYVNAGHDPALLVRAGGSVDLLGQGGLVLGVLPGIEYAQAGLRFGPDDLLVVYTDGLSEALDPDGSPFGLGRIRDAVGPAPSRPAREVRDRLLETWTSFRATAPQEDDLTLLVVRGTAGRPVDALTGSGPISAP